MFWIYYLAKKTNTAHTVFFKVQGQNTITMYIISNQ